MTAFTYPRNEPGSGGHLDLIERLNAIPASLRSEIAGLAEEAVAARPAQGEWSIKEICGHFCDSAHFLNSRLAKMIMLEQPHLEAWNQDVEMEKRNPQAARIDDLLAEFSARRAETVGMLADLVHWNWARTGHHESYGRLSIRQLVDHALEHEEDHLAQLRTLKQQRQIPTAP